ncbi:MAG: translation initiation factor IF-6 [Thermoprotei archaeon]|nr:MAG: translation initiation factor IF-6 [Thermoprotei archaeon]
MELDRIRVYGTPHIGVYIFANNHVAIIPPGLDKSIKEVIAEVLDVEIIETKIGGSVLNGVLLAGNDRGIIVPRNIREEELVCLREGLRRHDIDIYISRSRSTALGNLLLVNNKAGVVSSILEPEEVRRISETLGIEILVKDPMRLNIPGSIAVVTDKGGAIHPDIEDKELEELCKILMIYIERATVNSGIPFIKSGLVANNKGILVGETTTGPEILRIRRGFGGVVSGSE